MWHHRLYETFQMALCGEVGQELGKVGQEIIVFLVLVLVLGLNIPWCIGIFYVVSFLYRAGLVD